MDGFVRVAVPGELAQPFDQGRVHIYVEMDSVVSESSSLPQVAVFSPDGSPVNLVPYLRLSGTNDGWTYDIASHRGLGLGSFNVDRPGEYRITASGGDGLVLALGEGIGQKREKLTFNAVGYAFLGFVAGGISAGVVALMRRRTAA